MTIFELLLDKYLQKNCTPEEKETLLDMIARSENDLLLRNKIDAAILNMKEEMMAPEQKTERILSLILQAGRPVHFLKKAWFRYAAMLLLIAGSATFLHKIYRHPQKETAQITQRPTDILPGSDKAILTLASGERIQLDSSAKAYLAERGIRNSQSSISYQNPPAISSLNTLTTPRGGQYKLQLSDGTLVWLNAASSIIYPTNFTGRQRSVTVTGEAYFEVAKNNQKPFIVKTVSDQIQVLGTSFNVNAYADEAAVKTSLLEGSVKVGDIILVPGQAYSGGRVMITNTEQDIAWKNGAIIFEDKPLQQVMREIARWYDIDIVYNGKVPNVRLGGKLSRNVSLSGMIAALEAIEIHVRLEGRRLVILSE